MVFLVYFAGSSKRLQQSLYVFTEEQCKSTATASEPCSPAFKGDQTRTSVSQAIDFSDFTSYFINVPIVCLTE